MNMDEHGFLLEEVKGDCGGLVIFVVSDPDPDPE